MGELATDDADQERYLEQAGNKMGTEHLARLDAEVARLESVSGGFRGWIFPGENPSHAFFDLARTTCRRAERNCFALQSSGGVVRSLVIQYLNRLADVLWLLGRETLG